MALWPGGQPVQATAAAIGGQITQANQSSAQMAGGAQGFKAAAGTGFHLTPDAAATLINGCQEAISFVGDAIRHMDRASQLPKLGDTPVAKVAAPFTQQVATDNRGMMPALLNLRQTLHDMVDAYRKASTNYQETEAIIARALNAQQNTPRPPAVP